MSEISQKTLRRNKISAWVFFASAIFTIVLTIIFVGMFVMIFGMSQVVIDSGMKVTFGDTYTSQPTEFSGFLYASKQLYIVWILCAVAFVAQIAAFALMIKKSKFGRPIGIAAFVIAALSFPPTAPVLIYPFAFLIGNDGKYLYRNL